jgi:hypothetical protein
LSPLISMEAHLSPATDLFSQPKMHAVLSTFITMCKITPTNSSVVVLFSNFAPLPSFFCSRPSSGQNNWFAKIIFRFPALFSLFQPFSAFSKKIVNQPVYEKLWHVPVHHVITFYVATNFTKLQIISVLNCWRKKFGPIFKEL